MQSQSNEFRPQPTERLFLAVVNQAVSEWCYGCSSSHTNAE